MRILGSGLFSALLFGFLLVCLGGSTGCDSKPSDGTVIQDAGSTDKEAAEESDQRRLERKKNAQKTKKLTRKR